MDDFLVTSLGEQCVAYFGNEYADAIWIITDDRQLTAKVFVSLKEDTAEHRAAVAETFPDLRRLFIDELSLEFVFEQHAEQAATSERLVPGVRALQLA